jgi:hypothetical protein
MLFSGAWGKMTREQNLKQNKKSRYTVPLSSNLYNFRVYKVTLASIRIFSFL